MAVSERREKEIILFLQPYMEECYLKTCLAVQKWLDNQAEAVWEELENAIRKVLYRAGEQQKLGKGDIQYLAFSFMRYGVCGDEPEIFIEALDDAFYLDERETACCYFPVFLKDRFREDCGILYRKAGESFVRLQDYELEEIRKWYADYYSSILFRMLQGLAELTVGAVRGSGIPTTDRFTVIYGEYMGQAAVLYREGEDNEVFHAGNER